MLAWIDGAMQAIDLLLVEDIIPQFLPFKVVRRKIPKFARVLHVFLAILLSKPSYAVEKSKS